MLWFFFFAFAHQQFNVDGTLIELFAQDCDVASDCRSAHTGVIDMHLVADLSMSNPTYKLPEDVL